ncbi:MAG: DHA2 family efflux MFS transporter permease subunit [Alysiella sp.]|uniref:DHA2 family efflux MFS transporter permease subunit n=1 Tax=Alysiella sp. TaxID=1872483 RepID=UPI0026DC3AD6|nr:DHA2 family efflux MFS transporter permease subunit [Alysiella sp.]MDO4432998.1 DHA2 family efflux MFS transporter permease subunit [Alysiella sp.]
MSSNVHAMPPVSRFLPVLLALAVFMQMLDSTVLNTALPSMANDLGKSPLQMQSAIVSYALTLALMMPLSGFLCDRYGTRQVFFIALLVFVAGSVLCAAAPNLSTLVIARIVQGLGGAMLAPLPRLVIMRAYDKSRLVSMMNFVIMPALIGPVIGPVVGGYLVEYASWHWIFLINLPFGLLAAWFTLKIMPDFRGLQEGKRHFDLTGFLLFGGGAAGLSLAVEVAQHENAQLFSALCALLSFWALGLYWRHSQIDPQPLYGRDLLAVRTFRLGLSGNLASRLGMSAVPFLLPLLLQVGFGRGAAEAGWALVPVALATIAAKPLIQPLMRRLGYRRLLMVNTCLIGMIIASFALTTATTPWWILLSQLIALGVCNSIQFTSMNTLTLADLRPVQAASGTSLMTVNQQLAIGFGIALGAAMLQYFSQTPLLDGTIQTGFRCTFVAMGSMTVLASLIFARLHRKDGENLLWSQK